MTLLSVRIVLLFAILSAIWACPFDDTLREYLSAHFWQPFSKYPYSFEKRNVKRISVPFAGMAKSQSDTPLLKLRAEYQKISQPQNTPLSFDQTALRQAIASARTDGSLTAREREEVDLIEAKIDMRAGQPKDPESFRSAQQKFEKFLRSARTAEFLSEARGWLAHIHYVLGEQTAAGKIYLDELNRNGSNLSRETILNSLSMTYGYGGGQTLLDHLEEYFDTPEHAAFAIQLITNPRWDRTWLPTSTWGEQDLKIPPRDNAAESYAKIRNLLESHSRLLESETGANALALLGMRTALRMGDPPEALRIAAMVPNNAAIRKEPDFDWMLASAYFLSHEYSSAEQPLLSLFQSPRATGDERAAAAYGLCGVYQKTGNPLEQIHYALWLRAPKARREIYAAPPDIADGSVYWAFSGWDLNMLLESEAPVESLRSFIATYPNAPALRLVKYSLAVRMARENQYEEAAQIYQSINSNERALRMRRLAALYQEASRTDLSVGQQREAKYKLAEYISANPDRLYFNAALWSGLQRYALVASTDSRLTREERERMMTGERKLKDDQEERWRAYLILREVIIEGGKTDLSRKAAQLAIQCLRGISERFGRLDEIRQGIIELSRWLRQ
jgi:hypothetical protein